MHGALFNCGSCYHNLLFLLWEKVEFTITEAGKSAEGTREERRVYCNGEKGLVLNGLDGNCFELIYTAMQ